MRIGSQAFIVAEGSSAKMRGCLQHGNALLQEFVVFAVDGVVGQESACRWAATHSGHVENILFAVQGIEASGSSPPAFRYNIAI